MKANLFIRLKYFLLMLLYYFRFGQISKKWNSDVLLFIMNNSFINIATFTKAIVLRIYLKYIFIKALC